MLAAQLKESVFEGEEMPLLYRFARVANWIWISLLGFPLVALLQAHVSTLHLVLALAGCGAFVAAFCTMLLRFGRGMPIWLERGLLAALFSIAVAMTAADRPGWASMFMYPAGAAAMWMILPRRVALAAVIVCVLAAVGLVASWQPEAGAIISTATTGGGVCILMLCFGQLRRRNLELIGARDQIARLAVSEERLRFARDLHDLLGHSLSVIALKAELAGRLIERDAADAAAHVRDLEQVARTALAEVREAASGYRQPLLANELDGARIALQAAGIDMELERSEAKLLPEVEALLAWTVREGTTNVIRHSRARKCRFEIKPGLAAASVEVCDDGACIDSADAVAARNGLASAAGHGLSGLRERAERLGGRLEAGAAPSGGFRLRVLVPTRPAASAADPASVQPRPTAPAADFAGAQSRPAARVADPAGRQPRPEARATDPVGDQPTPRPAEPAPHAVEAAA